MKSEIDELVRKRESVRGVAPAITLISACVAFATTMVAAFGPRPYLAAVFACSCAAFMITYYAFRQARFDLEVIDKLAAMEARLRELEAGQASLPPVSSGK